MTSWHNRAAQKSTRIQPRVSYSGGGSEAVSAGLGGFELIFGQILFVQQPIVLLAEAGDALKEGEVTWIDGFACTGQAVVQYCVEAENLKTIKADGALTAGCAEVRLCLPEAGLMKTINEYPHS